MLSAVVGLNWGDEGKGKMVDAITGDVDYVVRYHGGGNAGHTVVVDEGKFSLHNLPSSVFRPGVVSVLGPGMVVDVENFVAEVEFVAANGADPARILVADTASVCFPFHRDLDAAEEIRLGKAGYGSTRMGISPGYGDRVMKKTLLVRELFDTEHLDARLASVLDWANARLTTIYGATEIRFDDVREWVDKLTDRLRPHVVDVTSLLREAFDEGKHVLAEGQLGALKDIYFGIYPFTTSSTCLAAHAPVGMGVPWAKLDRVIGVSKAFSSCVGAGPFVSEFDEETADHLREKWGEYGATTNRPRRLGAFDGVATAYGVLMQGADEVALTNLDQLTGIGDLKICVAYECDGVRTSSFSSDPNVLERSTPVYETLPGWNDDITGVRSYDELPAAARAYVERIEQLLGAPVRYVSVGAHRDALIDRGKDL
ncbi:adenylosuccinate synthase [Lentzea nigeriaca]|uniref:adenylosuccinate synthase n=1 Tax=Lentzea nigeriaca TaxID=1128665 RepID=UPI001959347D|nr:adenylosuccinate synthase [Lentzea nigeriaca]MBM7856457.1 adenylosuccinate synthase [Lentzea nigeriaca]